MLRLNHITFACAEPQRVAEFWTTMLDDYEADGHGDAWFGRGEGPALFFRRAEK